MDLSALMEAVATLNSEDAFGPRLSPEAWQALEPMLTRHEVRAGELLLKQDELDRTMYFLERGSLQVFVTRSAPGTHRVAILRAGSVVGEAGLFGETPRMANVEAMSNCVVWAFRAPRLDELSARHPALALEVVRGAAAVLAARMRANLERAVPVS
ncbi:cyclic nucleotide-binding domain-containing protein [Aquincola sp. MAHUQ-54]|uniref:Cyclic nucleotide-binding domain-containing protein n=1 Tax=Aquincola agrisoli TaxID=3119538 RepID=A0AAW9QHT4_9BURK